MGHPNYFARLFVHGIGYLDRELESVEEELSRLDSFVERPMIAERYLAKRIEALEFSDGCQLKDSKEDEDEDEDDNRSRLSLSDIFDLAGDLTSANGDENRTRGSAEGEIVGDEDADGEEDRESESVESDDEDEDEDDSLPDNVIVGDFGGKKKAHSGAQDPEKEKIAARVRGSLVYIEYAISRYSEGYIRELIDDAYANIEKDEVSALSAQMALKAAGQLGSLSREMRSVNLGRLAMMMSPRKGPSFLLKRALSASGIFSVIGGASFASDVIDSVRSDTEVAKLKTDEDIRYLVTYEGLSEWSSILNLDTDLLSLIDEQPEIAIILMEIGSRIAEERGQITQPNRT